MRLTLHYWRTGGLADWRTGGLADWRTGGLADWRTGGLADWPSFSLITVLIARTHDAGRATAPAACSNFARTPIGWP